MEGTQVTGVAILTEAGEARVWYTAREFAELGLAGVAATERGVNIEAGKRSWRPSILARRRAGRGGGWEYHVDLLPEAARRELKKRQDTLLISARQETLRETIAATPGTLAVSPDVPAKAPVRRPHAGQSVQTIAPETLTARQRLVAEARAYLCLEVERRAILHETSERQAIVHLVDEGNRGLKRPEDLRTASPNLIARAELANDRRQGLSRSTVSAWLAARRQGGVPALAPRPKQKWALDAQHYPWAPGFLSYYATPQKRTAAHALDMYIKSLADPSAAPSYDQVKRYLTALKKADPVAAHRGREGVLALKARKVYVSRSTDHLLPTDVYTADGKTFDAFVAHPFSGLPFRPEITSILDVATRRCTGFSIGLSEKAYDVAEAIRAAATHCGVSAIFYVDNGKGYKNLTLDDAATGMLARLGTHKEHSLPYNSQARGIIERFNGTCYTRLAKELPSYCGEDLDREARLKLDRRLKADIKEFGGPALLPNWQDFLSLFSAALSDYNSRPHSSLPEIWDAVQKRRRPMSPDEYWAHHVENGFQPILLTQAESDDLARPAMRRRGARGVVTIEKNSYFAVELEAFDRRDVMVSYDVLDASKVWVRELEHVDGVETGGRLIAVAKFAGNEKAYFPQTVIEAAREKKTEAALKRARKHVERIELERRPGLFLETSGEMPMEMFASSPAAPDVPATEPPALILVEATAPKPSVPAKITATSDGRRVFRSDAELAAFAIEHSSELTSTQRAVLADCLSNGTDREFLKLKGIDLDALKAALRAAA